MSRPLSHVSQTIWEQKYRYSGNGHTEPTIEASWRRVAQAAAGAEPAGRRKTWERRFFDAMADQSFLPAGRILAGAGTGRAVTLFNCFVMGEIQDDMGAIFENVKQAALTMQQGGGIGHDFSTLRPKGAPVRKIGSDASGPVSFMDVWDAMCRTIKSAGSRRGAMMGTLACDHPDIEAFIEAKADPAKLRNFNLSVLITDAFMAAVDDNATWPLRFGGKTFRTVRARALWNKIMRSAYDYAEPGVIFIDRVNRQNNLGYCETIHATNPCGEQPLPAYGACLLGSINLAALIKHPFEDTAALDERRLEALVPVAVRLLDNVIDISGYPLEAQRKEATNKRRIGLGITGLADALIMCGKHYGSADAVALAKRWMSAIERMAYLASTELAREKGPFPLFDADRHLERGSALALPEEVRSAIRTHGLRNGLLTSIAPTGTISLLADNVSSGIEPVFDFSYRRRILQPDGSSAEDIVEDYAHRLFRAKFGADVPLPPAFVTAHQLSPEQHLNMQAALQVHVDSGISKTINCPEDISFSKFKDIYRRGYALGLKGCTVYRPNEITGAVLIAGTSASAGVAGQAQQSLALDAPSPPTPTSGGPHDADIVYMSQPLERTPVLPGFTYKLKWPGSDHALYVTINDIMQDGRRRPFEIFINSKNLEHYAWTVALTRMISAVFRRGGDVAFVVEELKDVFDPRGGYWLEGRYVPSLLAAIGGVVEAHMIAIGFIQPQPDSHIADLDATDSAAPGPYQRSGNLPLCPKCSRPSMIFQEGCLVCRECGYSRCS
jgi:ribonucleoside-diphosphate reductase alpha chain